MMQNHICVSSLFDPTLLKITHFDPILLKITQHIYRQHLYLCSVGFVHKQHPCQPVKVVCGTLAGFTPILTKKNFFYENC